MPSDPLQSDSHSFNAGAGKISFSGVEPSTAEGAMLGRIYQSLAQFTVLTTHLRSLVDERLANHLTVTGWHEGQLRVHLNQPALATRWRFQEPAVRRAMIQQAGLAGLREIRLVLTDVRGHSVPANRDKPAAPSALLKAPVQALRDLAEAEQHPALRRALLALSDAAARAQKKES